jgi:hypothetical protein
MSSYDQDIKLKVSNDLAN